MPDRWDAEAEQILCCCVPIPGHNHMRDCLATPSQVAEVAHLARRAYREALEWAAETAAHDAWVCPDHPLHSDAHGWCHAALAIEAAIRREIEGL